MHRKHCVIKEKGGKSIHTKDLRALNRDIKDIIIVDNSPHNYELNPENAIPISSWSADDTRDTELIDYIPLLASLSKVEDVREAIKEFVKGDRIKDVEQAIEICQDMID